MAAAPTQWGSLGRWGRSVMPPRARTELDGLIIMAATPLASSDSSIRPPRPQGDRGDLTVEATPVALPTVKGRGVRPFRGIPARSLARPFRDAAMIRALVLTAASFALSVAARRKSRPWRRRQGLRRLPLRAASRPEHKLYTHLCHAFVTAGADGALRPGRSVPLEGSGGRGPRGGRQGLALAGRVGAGTTSSPPSPPTPPPRTVTSPPSWRWSTNSTTTASTSTGSTPFSPPT